MFGVDNKKQAKSFKEALQEAGLGMDDDDEMNISDTATVDWKGNPVGGSQSKNRFGIILVLLFAIFV